MALIKRMPLEPKFDFMAKRNLLLGFSVVLVVLAVALFFARGLNFGVDFRGGILIEAKTAAAEAPLGEMRATLSGLGLGEITLQTFGEPDVILINVERQTGDESEQVKAIEVVKAALADQVTEYRRTEFVGPKVGAELKRAGVLATLLSMLGIGLYIWFRFEWQFSLAALAALAHDVITTVGFYALTGVEFNLATLAAVLTIAGYSINDTVVLFDRVRETLRKYKKLPLDELLNMAINRTLTRTLLTSFTTLLALIALALFGGQVIQGFTLGLIWGVVIGTYSSIALAVPMLVRLNIRRFGESGEEQEEATSRA